MTAYADPRFRPTLWPGTPVPLPELTPLAGARADGDWIVWDIGNPMDFEQETACLPEDFYMRELMEADPRDLVTVAGWMSRYGHLGDIDSGSWDEEELQRLRDLEDREHPRFGPWSIHGDLVQFHVSEAQEAIATWLSLRRPGGLDDLVEMDVTEERLAQEQEANSDHDQSYPRDLDDLRSILLWLRLAQLRGALGSGLAPFSVGLNTLTERRPSVLSVAFLQLYNHLAEKATIRECANETCRRAYVRQRGRAEYGQNRTTGTKYCTRECARAQAQREHRRRRRAAAAAPPDPSRAGTNRGGRA
ncbi:hypothetical protein [Streptomyces jumonjinensis]|nr:hypothetical protein [Streptomyces jumonjinensis]